MKQLVLEALAMPEDISPADRWKAVIHAAKEETTRLWIQAGSPD